MRLFTRSAAVFLLFAFSQLFLADGRWLCVAHGGNDVPMHPAARAGDMETGEPPNETRGALPVGRVTHREEGMSGECGHPGPAESGTPCGAGCLAAVGCGVAPSLPSGAVAAAATMTLAITPPLEAATVLSRPVAAPEPPPPRL